MKIKYFALILSSLLFFSSCKKDTESHTLPEQFIGNSSLTPELRGKLLFKSIYFGEGHMANNIDMLQSLTVAYNNMPDHKKADVDFFKVETIENISNHYPLFFSIFDSLIMSDNFEEITNGIDYGGNILFASVIDNPKYSSLLLVDSTLDISSYDYTSNESLIEFQNDLKGLVKVTDDNSDEYCAPYIGFCVALAVAVWEAVVAVNVAVVGTVAVWVYALGPIAPGSTDNIHGHYWLLQNADSNYYNNVKNNQNRLAVKIYEYREQNNIEGN